MSGSGGRFEGSNTWTVADIPLVPDETNVVAIVATTTSWDAADGGNTTFGDNVSVFYSPIHAVLALDGTHLSLNWTGGVGPYNVQRATDLKLRDWITIETNVAPPLAVSPEGVAVFYRILGK